MSLNSHGTVSDFFYTLAICMQCKVQVPSPLLPPPPSFFIYIIFSGGEGGGVVAICLDFFPPTVFWLFVRLGAGIAANSAVKTQLTFPAVFRRTTISCTVTHYTPQGHLVTELVRQGDSCRVLSTKPTLRIDSLRLHKTRNTTYINSRMA